ncbi:MAG: class I SAM-dependent methyltransferase [Calditrichaeota bacterium]|nr:MAG: class I SAM-dependent methyltransferase [Calditrichota bacterium]
MPFHSEQPIKQVDNYKMVAAFYDYLMRHVNYQRWYKFVSAIVNKHHVGGANILEMACGTGKMLEQFIRAGWMAVGVDKSAAMLDRAKRRIPMEFQENNLIVGDMRDSRIYGEFSAVICLYDSINYCMTEEELKKSLQNMLDNLLAGGVLIFDICTIYNCSHNFRDYHEKEFYRDLDYTREAYFNPATNQQTNEFWITESEREEIIYHEKHIQQMYRISVVKKIIEEEIGSCKILGIFENYTRRVGSEKSERVHFVVKKT